jgi:hypothetical protein
MDGPDGSPFPIRAKLPAGYRNAHVVLRAGLCHRLSITGVDAAYAVGNLSTISLLAMVGFPMFDDWVTRAVREPFDLYLNLLPLIRSTRLRFPCT